MTTRVTDVNTRYVTLAAAGAALGGFLFGFDTSTMNSAIPGMRTDAEHVRGGGRIHRGGLADRCGHRGWFAGPVARTPCPPGRRVKAPIADGPRCRTASRTGRRSPRPSRRCRTGTPPECAPSVPWCPGRGSRTLSCLAPVRPVPLQWAAQRVGRPPSYASRLSPTNTPVPAFAEHNHVVAAAARRVRSGGLVRSWANREKHGEGLPVVLGPLLQCLRDDGSAGAPSRRTPGSRSVGERVTSCRSRLLVPACDPAECD